MGVVLRALCERCEPVGEVVKLEVYQIGSEKHLMLCYSSSFPCPVGCVPFPMYPTLCPPCGTLDVAQEPSLCLLPCALCAQLFIL